MRSLRSISGAGAAALWLFASLATSGCGDGSGGGETSPAADPAAGHAHEGAHGGEILGLGNEEVHVEFVLDDHAGRIDLYILGADGTTALEIGDAPAINIKTAQGPKQLATAPAEGTAPSSHFSLLDPAFKDHHLDGQLVIRALGKEYYVALPTHSHEADPAHVHAENAISFTAWTERFEWFVELEAPEAGKPAAFAAHVTLLDSFQPVTVGTFQVEASGGGKTATTLAGSPVRPGIFTPSIVLPTAGNWTLKLTYEGQALSDTVEWPITVHAPGESPTPAEDPPHTISFLKEQQWKIPFATAAVAAGDPVTIPASALLEGSVIVQRGGESFERRAVETGAETNGRFEVLSGLRPGERMVTKGAEAMGEAGG